METNWSLYESNPLLTKEGEQMLIWLREHPHAPVFNHLRHGNRLTAEGLQRVREFENELKDPAQRGWVRGEYPPWLMGFAEFCYQEAPFYRSYGALPDQFVGIPCCTRDDLARAPWKFVPDSASLEDLGLYATSGTTGHPIDILTHPEVGAKYVPLLRTALAPYRLELEGGSGKVACLQVCFQKTTYTLVSVAPFLDHAGFAKINLNPDDWKEPGDRGKFISDCNPEIFTGDPISFAELARLDLKVRPKALVSTAMSLSRGLREKLEAHFQCPVVDMYSLNETGPVAAASPDGEHYLLLQNRLYVEILDENSVPVFPGQVGEITLSGGFNPFIPLLRYRTGDRARLEFLGSQPSLVGLEGRPPTRFVTSTGNLINNIDITLALRDFNLVQYSVHQNKDRSLVVRFKGDVPENEISSALRELFGTGQKTSTQPLEEMPTVSGKIIQYTSDLTLDLV